MKEKTNKNRIEWVDAAKGLGLILVVLGHLKFPYLSTWIYTFHIPLFFFLSGFVFSGQKYSFKQYLLKKIKTLVIPYFALGLVIYLVWCGIYLTENRPLDAYFIMLWNFIKQKHFWTIWFLACLFLVEILYYWIDKVSQNHCWIATIISSVLCVLGFIWYRLGGEGLFWNLDVALVAQFFFHFGWLFKKYPGIRMFLLQKKILRTLFLVLIFGLINIVAAFACIKISGQSLDMSVGIYGNEILTMISAFAGILCVIMMCNLLPLRTFQYLGKNTMLIFAWHSRIILVLMELLYAKLGLFQTQSTLSQIIGSGIVFVVIFIVLVPINELIKKTRLKWMIGK